VAHVTAGGALGGGGVASPQAVAHLAGSLGPQYQLDIPFVVRAREPGSQSSILVFVNDTTYEAYNFWSKPLWLP
jgi:hypothetical protein